MQLDYRAKPGLLNYHQSPLTDLSDLLPLIKHYITVTCNLHACPFISNEIYTLLLSCGGCVSVGGEKQTEERKLVDD